MSYKYIYTRGKYDDNYDKSQFDFHKLCPILFRRFFSKEEEWGETNNTRAVYSSHYLNYCSTLNLALTRSPWIDPWSDPRPSCTGYPSSDDKRRGSYDSRTCFLGVCVGGAGWGVWGDWGFGGLRILSILSYPTTIPSITVARLP